MELNLTEPADYVRMAEERTRAHLDIATDPLSLAELMDDLTRSDFPEDAVPIAVNNLVARGVVRRDREHKLEAVRASDVSQAAYQIPDEYAPDRRLHDEHGPASLSEFKRDRDRILYSAPFQRLAGITQVTSSESGMGLHNRLTHSLKVAHVARQIAERLKERASELSQAVIRVTDDAVDTAEAAALAHDMGHPPFGHVAERKLDELMIGHGGFEGNGQTFRLVTFLATGPYLARFHGLNLTRATLNGILKYPWKREGGARRDHHTQKFGAYTSDHEAFEFARHGKRIGCEGTTPEAKLQRSLEAEIMDWADDVSYAVHDLEDFYKARLIPFGALAASGAEQKRFLSALTDNRELIANLRHAGVEKADVEAASEELFCWIAVGLRQAFDGTRLARANLRESTSRLLSRFLRSITLRERVTEQDPRIVEIDPADVALVAVLKHLTWHYVIDSPALASIQHGQVRIITTLWDYYFDAAKSRGKRGLMPLPDRLDLDRAGDNEGQQARVVCDLIAGMTEQRAVAMYGRLQGLSPGSVLDAVAG